MEYKIGQILTSTKDVEVEKALTEEKVIVKKGNKIIIGADKLAHHIYTGMIQPLQEDAIIKGYDTKGLAEYLYLCLSNHFELEETLDDYVNTKERYIEEIKYALDEIL